MFGHIEYEMGVEECATHFLDILNFDTVRAVYEWAKGKVGLYYSVGPFFCIFYYFSRVFLRS